MTVQHRGAAPLVVTGDHHLGEEVLRLSAAAGVAPHRCDTVDGALALWRAASVVLVGVDLAPELVGTVPERTGPVHLVTTTAARAEDYRLALRLGADSVCELPAQELWLVDRFGDLADDPDRAPAPVVAVLGGSGGAGASVLAAALGRCAAAEGSALVVDLDRHGPGATLVGGLSHDEAPQVGWETLAERGGRLSGHALREALPGHDRLSVLTWQGLPGEVPAETCREAVDAGARGHDLVVLDLPRSLEVPRGLMARVDLVVLVARPDVTGLASAGRTVLSVVGPRVVVVVRGARSRSGLLDEVAGAPVVARMTDQRRLQDALDLGFGPLRRLRGPLHRAARQVLAEVGA